MTGPLINRSIPFGGGTISKVPLKGRLRSFSKKYAQEKRTKSDTFIEESRSPSYEYNSDTAPARSCSREEPEEERVVTPLLSPTALRPSMSSPPFTTFEFDKKRHGMSSLSRKLHSSTKKQTQIRSPRQSKKALKKLPPSLSGSGAAAHSPWVAPSGVQIILPSAAVKKEEFTMYAGPIHSASSFQEHDLPHAIRPCYKFVPIEVAEMIEEEEANATQTYDSLDYDICSEEYKTLYPEADGTIAKKQKEAEKEALSQKSKTKMKRSKSSSQSKSSQKRNKQKKLRNKTPPLTPQTPLFDKYSTPHHHYQEVQYESKPKSGWWKSLEKGIRYSYCCSEDIIVSI